MNKGDSKKALEYLLPVTERDPENVAALALLADAYLLDAAWTSYEKTAKRLKPLPVRTAEETLLKARALRIIGDRVPIMRHQQFSTTERYYLTHRAADQAERIAQVLTEVGYADANRTQQDARKNDLQHLP